MPITPWEMIKILKIKNMTFRQRPGFLVKYSLTIVFFNLWLWFTSKIIVWNCHSDWLGRPVKSEAWVETTLFPARVFKMADEVEVEMEDTVSQLSSSSLKQSTILEKRDETEGRRMESFRKVMNKCLDKIMAAGRWDKPVTCQRVDVYLLHYISTINVLDGNYTLRMVRAVELF